MTSFTGGPGAAQAPPPASLLPVPSPVTRHPLHYLPPCCGIEMRQLQSEVIGVQKKVDAVVLENRRLATNLQLLATHLNLMISSHNDRVHVRVGAAC